MIQIEKIWITDKAVCIRTTDGREASENLADYPRLRYATAKQLANFTSDNFGIHWEDVDEDLSFEGFFYNKNRTLLYRIFTQYPELNAAAIARRMNMKQSLLAAYINGTKKPSEDREKQIINTIKTIGNELSSLQMA